MNNKKSTSKVVSSLKKTQSPKKRTNYNFDFTARSSAELTKLFRIKQEKVAKNVGISSKNDSQRSDKVEDRQQKSTNPLKKNMFPANMTRKEDTQESNVKVTRQMLQKQLVTPTKPQQRKKTTNVMTQESSENQQIIKKARRTNVVCPAMSLDDFLEESGAHGENDLEIEEAQEGDGGENDIAIEETQEGDDVENQLIEDNLIAQPVDDEEEEFEEMNNNTPEGKIIIIILYACGFSSNKYWHIKMHALNVKLIHFFM